ncbi:hypothetical protein ACOAKG_29340 [Streptomyces sp. JL3001]|uniref:hypothetical protein n=1 Tax=Streptomyces sp. JL3001 TaxID=3400923 RepID=UPI003B288AEC
MQGWDCQLAESRFGDAGRQGKWEIDPEPWNVIKGLIAACWAGQGRPSEWQTVINAYADVKDHPSGSCKYAAAFQVLEQLALFLMEHPDGKVEFRDAPQGSTACESEIKEYSSLEVPQGGKFWVRGTWPVPVSLYFNGIKAPFQDGDPSVRCCHGAVLSVDAPNDLPLGEAKVSLRGEDGSFYLEGPSVQVLPPAPQP